MTDIHHDRPFRIAAHPSAKPDSKGAHPPRSKREVAAFESMRAFAEMKRAGGPLPKRMSRWKR